MPKTKNIYNYLRNPTPFQIEIIEVCKNHTAAEIIHALEIIKLSVLFAEVED